jgi:uncharacterized membrane protein
VDNLFILLVILCALGSGAIGGVFFAFSNFVMPALARLAPAEGIHAMQAINVTVLNRLFLGIFMGTGALSLAVIVLALLRWDGVASLCVALAGATYVLGSIVVTMRGNVPLNNALMRITQTDALGEATWRSYVRDWTRWNTVRTIACFVAMALFIVTLWATSYPRPPLPVGCYSLDDGVAAACVVRPGDDTN